MDAATMEKWIRQIWDPWVNRRGNNKLLLLDHCSSHLTAAVLAALGNCKTLVDFVPPGYTSKLQIMDVGVNAPFKTHLRNSYNDWRVEQVINGGDPHAKPTRELVLQWVNAAWDSISTLLHCDHSL